MRSIAGVFTVLAVTLLLAPAEPADDLSHLHGTWTMVSRELNGEELAGEQVKTGKLVIEGNHYESVLGDRSMSATLKLDPKCSPKAVDFTYTEGPRKGETVKGIYRIENDRFVICRTLRDEDSRPTRFAAGAGSGLILVVWRRAETADVVKRSAR
jgi:uncharacterized protein (TIGR03067 family)